MFYVDQPIHSWRNKKWCHLVADDLGELHDFAAKLGLKKEWFQNHRIQPHYDITAAKREQAIKLGAIPIETKEMAQRVENILRERKSSV
jgi:hypothetical protein